MNKEDVVVVVEMSKDLVYLEKRMSKAEILAYRSFFFPRFFKAKREKARRDFWLAVRYEFPQYADMDANIRYDNRIVFKPYKVD